MRSFVITLIVLVAVIAGVLAMAPRFVDWNDYRELLTSQAEAVTGGTVKIDGHISVRLLPSPTLTLARIRLGGSVGDPTALVADRIDLRLRVLPLLRGDLEVGDIRLVRPVLQWQQAGEQGTPSWTDSNPLLSLITLRPDHLTLVDGRALLRDAGGAHWQIDTIDLEMTGESAQGPFTLRGGFSIDARPFHVDARIGRVSPDRAGSLQIALEVRGDRPARLTYNGAVWWRLDDPRARGDLVLAGEDGSDAIALIAGAFGQARPPLPPWLGQPFEIGGALQLDHGTLKLDELKLQLAGAEAEGSLSLALGAEPSIALELRAGQIALAAPADVGAIDLAPLAALARVLRGRIDLAIAALRHGERSMDRVRAGLTLAGDGTIAIEQASAILPGQTHLGFEGALVPVGETLGLEGNISAVTDDLGALLTWLDIEPPDVASGRLRTLSLTAALTVEGGALRLPQAEVRVDATQLRGSATLTPAGPSAGARAELTAELTLDRLNIDAYEVGAQPRDAAAAVRRMLGDLDATITAHAGRLTWGGLLMDDVAIALHAEQGRLEVSEASFAVTDEANARISGNVDLASGAFVGSAAVRTTRAARFLRRLGLAAPLTLNRAPPMNLTLEAAGTVEQFAISARVEDGAGHLTATGEAGWREGGARYDLEVALDHPDFSTLVRLLGARTALGGEEATPAALSFTGKVAGTTFQNTIAGSARLGGMSLTGLLAWREEEQRPRYDMQLSLAEPTAEMLAALLELAGLSPPVGLMDAPVLGNWPQQTLRLDWMSRFDGSLKLSAKGGLAGEGTELDARLQDGKLFVDRAAARHRQGRLSSELTLDAARPLPFATVALDLQEIDAAWLAAKLDLPPVIEGKLDLSAEATAAGWSLSDLIRGLIGSVEIAIPDGRLSGNELAPVAQALSEDSGSDGTAQQPSGAPPTLAFSDLSGRLGLKRGLASIEQASLRLDHTTATIAGVVDLLLWAGDLDLTLEDPAHPDAPIRLKIVGPLEHPQTRLTLPAPPASAASP